MRRRARALLLSAFAVLALGAVVFVFHDLGPQARHMALHILAMNVAAPLLAVLLTGRLRQSRVSWLWGAALGQIVLLWASHVPAIHAAAMQPTLQAVLHAVLLLSALVFWATLLSLPDTKRWHAIPALLLTGKLVCLLAALLVFAPRALYGAGHHGSTVDDQHLAALLMITACPLSYIVVAVMFTVELLNRATEAPWARKTS